MCEVTHNVFMCKKKCSQCGNRTCVRQLDMFDNLTKEEDYVWSLKEEKKVISKKVAKNVLRKCTVYASYECA